ncbi:DDE-type integrase/transposase/recombinase [Candidatus Nitrosotalea okcheonensis]|uniref:DDE-type integrase/transposase/recombinase n=1 Tax=Candidatus Nitrosotalea okcheonensis TaxID=1903276 RepID=UPI001E4C81DA|nr:DDE-type integrase/transposase/recombinase [Candidatus Nitrosotalea okcheonensis]
MKHDNNREERGKEIANHNQVRRIDEHHYKVKSQSRNLEHDVISTESGLICDCEDHIYRKICCKHIHAVEFSVKIRKEVKERNNVVIEQIDCSKCIECQSINIVKHGIRRNKSGDIQRFSCKDCGKWFVFNIGFEGMRVNPKAITSAMQLYFTGESLRNVQQFLKLQGVNVSHQTVYNWIKKYTKLMSGYLEKITPQVGDTWRSDELFLKISGNMKYMYALLDDETRYIIAQQVGNTKYKENINELFREGKKVAGKKPKVLITDGAMNFQQAYMKEFWARPLEQRTEHIRHIHFKNDMNNNKMERLNGEIRDREKTMRGLKKMDTPILKGYEIFHNYVRPHMGLDGKTPSEACGIKVEGDNKWITLIQNAQMSREFTRRTVSQ